MKTNTDKKIPAASQTDLNLRRLYLLMIGNWYYVVLSLLLTFGFALLYNKKTFPTFQTTATILIEEAEFAGTPGIESNLLEGFNVRPGAQNLENQIQILSSYDLIHKTLDRLPFDVEYFRKSVFNVISYYPLNPIKIITQPGFKYKSDTEFEFQHEEGNQYHLAAKSWVSDFSLDTIITFGTIVKTNSGSFRILPQLELEDVYKSGEKIHFKFNDLESLTEVYRERLSVSTLSREGSIVRLNLEGTNKAKDVVFLDKLTEMFIFDNLEKKNREARRIIDFIDAQLVDVSDSLMITENELQEFRSRNRIMDVSAQAQQIIDQSVVLENQQARLTLERNYYVYLEKYLAEESNDADPIAPATMDIQDPLLANLMQELAGLQAEYYSSGVSERNPLQAQLELRIQNTKQSIRETLQGIMLGSQMAIDENTAQINKINAQASRLPAKERQLLGIERKFNLNNVLYTFLLQRRAEAQIQKASNIPDNELLDYPRAGLKPVKPKTMAVFLGAFILGLGLPYLILVISNSVKNKVTSEEDIRMITDLPVVGHIPNSRLSYNTVVLNEPSSRIAEAFRNLRTRMDFFTKETKCPIIMFSSSIPGEGKTFSAINLASAYSLTGKKTLLVGFDLRRPTLSKSFEIKGNVGLSTYLIGKSNLKDIVMDTSYPNLSIIPSGPIPPNPGELTTSDKVLDLFKVLRRDFDFIVVDTAPIGTVSDNYKVASIADAILLMVRHGISDKNAFENTLMDIQSSGIASLGLLVNGVRSNSNSYRYAYNYKYSSKPSNGNGKSLKRIISPGSK